MCNLQMKSTNTNNYFEKYFTRIDWQTALALLRVLIIGCGGSITRSNAVEGCINSYLGGIDLGVFGKSAYT